MEKCHCKPILDKNVLKYIDKKLNRIVHLNKLIIEK